MLQDYFKPHTLLSLLSLLYLLFAFEVSGWGLTKALKIKTPNFLRPATWLFGLGQMVFLIFLSHFFVPYNGQLVILFATLIAWPWVKQYFKTSQHKKLFKILKLLKLPLLFFSPLAPLVFIKTSLPPHIWDEAVYHYISPYKLVHEKAWHFRGLYDSVPRLLDTTYISLFALTKSYASARLLHFLVYLTSLSSIYLFTKKHLSVLAGLIVFVILTYLQIPLLIQSTWGYVDLGVTAFITLTTLSLVEFFVKKNTNLVYLFLLFAGLGLGTKYNALAPSLIIGSFFLFQLIFKRSLKNLKSKKLIIVILSSLALGGYWYIKNWLITGNPIFPFFFDCKVPGCGVGQSFFDWTTALTLKNLPEIISQLLFNHWLLTPLSIAIIFLGLFLSRKNIRKILLLLLLTVAGEYVLLSFFAGFIRRYFYHWVIVLNLVFAISLYLVVRKIIFKTPIWLKNIAVVVFLAATAFIGFKKIVNLYKPYLPRQENYYQTRFALGRASIKDWTKWTLPATSEAIFWCDKQENLTTIMVKDPFLLWFTNETRFPIFLTNCQIRESSEDQAQYYLSLDDCSTPDKLPRSHKQEDERRLQMAWENHKIICKSEKIVPGLYRLVE